MTVTTAPRRFDARNYQWRVCFRFENGDALDVGITDYH